MLSKENSQREKNTAEGRKNEIVDNIKVSESEKPQYRSCSQRFKNICRQVKQNDDVLGFLP
jgi:hypothetical protein